MTALQQGEHKKIMVEDTGNGIPKDLRERIFEPIFPCKINQEAEHLVVSVLDWPLVREIVRVHDGNITVRDNDAGGTTFEVEF